MMCAIRASQHAPLYVSTGQPVLPLFAFLRHPFPWPHSVVSMTSYAPSACCHGSTSSARLEFTRAKYDIKAVHCLRSFLTSSYPPKLLREQTIDPQLHSTQRTMQFKVLAILSFMALTGSAQRCLKGNHANQGEGCEGVGNLICSHNLKHVVSTLMMHYNQRETICCHG
jgi:hypothetical protein